MYPFLIIKYIKAPIPIKTTAKMAKKTIPPTIMERSLDIAKTLNATNSLDFHANTMQTRW
jgi:hypothetical protein